MAESLEIHTLGGLQIRHDGVRLEGLGSRKAEALLIYLACNPIPQPREVLIDLLWDEQAPSAALNNLRWILAVLRRRFASYLQITRTTVALTLAPTGWLDVAALDAALGTGSGGPATPSPGWEAAVNLYAGPFLHGFYLREAQGFEEWMLAERDRLHRRVLTALHALAQQHLAAGTPAAGIAHAARLLHLEPLQEETHRLLMRLLVAGGERATALAQYDRCVQLLAAELGIAPEAATQVLAAEIRSGGPALMGPVTRPSAPLPAVPPALPVSPTPPQRRQMLPHYFTPFIGRALDLAQLAERLADPLGRLTTLVGPGGVGKSRLAVAAAQTAPDFPDGVYFVALAGVEQPSTLLPVIAEALALPPVEGDALARQLAAYLQPRRLLLILDNFEQLLEAGPLLLDLLAAAPQLALLVTSREPLDLSAEVLLDVGGLPLPPAAADPAALAASEAVQLFVERARRVQSRFALTPDTAAWVGELCHLVEGIPLALELAAVALRQEEGPALLTALRADLDRLATTQRDVPARHRSLRAVFDHSWARLTGDEQAAFRRLAVFPGGFEADAAAATIGQPPAATRSLLATLVGRSLLRRTLLGRYDLHELLRQYARTQLAASTDEPAARRRHAAHYRALVAAPTALPGSDLAWWTQLDREHENLRAMLATLLDLGPADEALRVATTLSEFWRVRGYAGEGRAWLERAQRAAGTAPAPDRAAALISAAALALSQGDFAAAGPLLEAGRALGASGGQAEWARRTTAWVLRHQARMATQQGSYPAATAYAVESLALFRDLNHPVGTLNALVALGNSLRDQGAFSRAVLAFQEALTLARTLDHPQIYAHTLRNLGALALFQGEAATAQTLLDEALALAQQQGDLPASGDIHALLGLTALAGNAAAQARRHAEQALAIARDCGSKWIQAAALFVCRRSGIAGRRLDGGRKRGPAGAGGAL